MILAEHQDDCKTLASLARVSTHLHASSITALWRSVDLDQLLRILPGDFAHRCSSSEKWVFERASEDSDWERLRHYSTHIDSLHVDVSSCLPTLLVLLGMVSDTLFPRLRTLKVVKASHQEYPSAEWMLLAVPSLEDLSVEGMIWPFLAPVPADNGAFNSFCKHLQRRTPNLQHLHLSRFPKSSISENQLSNAHAVHSLPLRTFTWDSTSPTPASIVHIIAHHPSISSVAFSSPKEWPAQLLSASCFPSLRKLTMSGPSGPIETCLESILHPCLLTDLILHPANTFSHTFLPPSQFFRAAWNLTSIHLDFECQSLGWDQLNSLCNCRRLKVLFIQSDRPIQGLDDAALREMALAFLNVQSVKILTPQPSLRPKITLYGLIPFAQFCPHLEELALEVTTHVNPLEWLNHSLLGEVLSLTQRPFKNLNLRWPEINTKREDEHFLGPRQTAHCLLVLWPSLRPQDLQITSTTWANSKESMEKVIEVMVELVWYRDIYQNAFDERERAFNERERQSKLERDALIRERDALQMELLRHTQPIASSQVNIE